MLALPGMEDLCWHDLAERSVLLAAARMLWACDSFFANRVQVEDIIVSADPETVHHHSAAGSPKMFLLQIKVGRSRADTSLRRLLGMQRGFGVVWDWIFIIFMNLGFLGDTSICSRVKGKAFKSQVELVSQE